MTACYICVAFSLRTSVVNATLTAFTAERSSCCTAPAAVDRYLLPASSKPAGSSYNTRCYFSVRSKADMSQLNLLLLSTDGTDGPWTLLRIHTYVHTNLYDAKNRENDSEALKKTKN